jgi:hypothetical protein
MSKHTVDGYDRTPANKIFMRIAYQYGLLLLTVLYLMYSTL